MVEQKSRGVLYIASGYEHIKAALLSAQSVRDTNPNLPIHLFADYQQQNIQLDAEPGPLTSWENISDPHRRSKVDYISRTPFEQTMYLDTDTRVLCDLEDVFCLLENFDVAMAGFVGSILPLHVRKRRNLGGVNVRLSSTSSASDGSHKTK